MKKNRSMPDAAIIPVLGYPDVAAAANWLCHAFGFKVRLRIGNHRIQLSYGDGAMVVSQAHASEGTRSSSHSIMVRVSGIDEHFARTNQAGAKALGIPTTFPFGDRLPTFEKSRYPKTAD